MSDSDQQQPVVVRKEDVDDHTPTAEETMIVEKLCAEEIGCGGIPAEPKRFPRVSLLLDGHYGTLLRDILDILQVSKCASQPAPLESNGWKVAFHAVYDSLLPACTMPTASNRYGRFRDRMVEVWKRIEQEVTMGKRSATDPETAMGLEQLNTFREASKGMDTRRSCASTRNIMDHVDENEEEPSYHDAGQQQQEEPHSAVSQAASQAASRAASRAVSQAQSENGRKAQIAIDRARAPDACLVLFLSECGIYDYKDWLKTAEDSFARSRMLSQDFIRWRAQEGIPEGWTLEMAQVHFERWKLQCSRDTHTPGKKQKLLPTQPVVDIRLADVMALDSNVQRFLRHRNIVWSTCLFETSGATLAKQYIEWERVYRALLVMNASTAVQCVLDWRRAVSYYARRQTTRKVPSVEVDFEAVDFYPSVRDILRDMGVANSTPLFELSLDELASRFLDWRVRWKVPDIMNMGHARQHILFWRKQVVDHVNQKTKNGSAKQPIPPSLLQSGPPPFDNSQRRRPSLPQQPGPIRQQHVPADLSAIALSLPLRHPQTGMAPPPLGMPLPAPGALLPGMPPPVATLTDFYAEQESREAAAAANMRGAPRAPHASARDTALAQEMLTGHAMALLVEKEQRRMAAAAATQQASDNVAALAAHSAAAGPAPPKDPVTPAAPPATPPGEAMEFLFEQGITSARDFCARELAELCHSYRTWRRHNEKQQLSIPIEIEHMQKLQAFVGQRQGKVKKSDKAVSKKKAKLSPTVDHHGFAEASAAERQTLSLLLDPPLRVLDPLAQDFLLSSNTTNTLQFLECDTATTAAQLVLWRRACQEEPLAPATAVSLIEGWKRRVMLQLQQQSQSQPPLEPNKAESDGAESQGGSGDHERRQSLPIAATTTTTTTTVPPAPSFAHAPLKHVLDPVAVEFLHCCNIHSAAALMNAPDQVLAFEFTEWLNRNGLPLQSIRAALLLVTSWKRVVVDITERAADAAAAAAVASAVVVVGSGGSGGGSGGGPLAGQDSSEQSSHYHYHPRSHSHYHHHAAAGSAEQLAAAAAAGPVVQVQVDGFDDCGGGGNDNDDDSESGGSGSSSRGIRLPRQQQQQQRQRSSSYAVAANGQGETHAQTLARQGRATVSTTTTTTTSNGGGGKNRQGKKRKQEGLHNNGDNDNNDDDHHSAEAPEQQRQWVVVASSQGYSARDR